MKELIFKEVIVNIKEDEVWESENYIIKCSHGIISIETKNGEVFNGIAFCDDILFTLQRKQYTFEEAFKALEEGKEIESCYEKGVAYKKQDDIIHITLNNKPFSWWKESEYVFSVGQIRGKWYIND